MLVVKKKEEISRQSRRILLVEKSELHNGDMRLQKEVRLVLLLLIARTKMTIQERNQLIPSKRSGTILRFAFLHQ